MSTEAKAQDKGLRGTEAQAITRLLLGLWDLGGAEREVTKTELITDRVKLNKERVKDYQDILEKLQEKGAITIEVKKRKPYISLTETGLQMLAAGLNSSDFKFDGEELKPRDKDINAVLRWLRESGTVGNGTSLSVNTANNLKAAIASYEEFKQVVLDIYDQLNQEHNFNNLVPIYRLRQQISDRLTRSEFNEWLLEMQANDIFQLMAGEMSDITPDKREDSITIPGGGLRYYAKLLNS
ncbi:MAG: hypothetical protein F6J89_07290 [Symploca sp. SIO1C4]|uniref:Uncharacterized protein n=1 Tax=Symploca sp. SIO1C4 TaxID=2607765 RepID=A0A6B3N7A7_9CYAN|nr:hypothetical protein [Symploca sp. SIO1C4]